MTGPSVLHVLHTTNRRGAEIFGYELAGGLTEAGLKSTVRAIEPGLMANQLPVETVGLRGRTPLATARLRVLARRHDVVVGHGSSTLLAGSAATVGARTPFVYRLIGDPRFWSDVPLRGLRASRPLRRAAGVVALWDDAAEALEELHGIAPERIHVIANGRDATRYVPPTAHQRSSARAALGLPAAGPVVGYLGALSWEKDPVRAVQAIGSLPDVSLVMAGDGPLRAEVEAAARSVGSRVVLLDTVADPREVIWAVDLLLLTSLTEGMPGVVIEAGLCGIASVAADVGGTRDLICDTTGRLVPQGSTSEDFAAAVAAALPVAPALGHAARARVLAGYTLDASVARWAELLRGLA